MRVYVDSQGGRIAKDGHRLLLEVESERTPIPLPLVGSLVLGQGLAVTSDALHALLLARTPTVFLTHGGKYLGRLAGPNRGRVARLRAQFAAQAGTKGLLVAREIVLAKVSNQWHTLKALERNRRRNLDLPAQPELPDRALDRDMLMGFEGNAARLYWLNLAAILPDEWGFRKRRARPAQDPANALLNYLYAVLLARSVLACEIAGFEPHAGFLHADRPARPSLALDLMEPLRPFVVDRTFLKIVGQGLLKPTDFEGTAQGVRLTEKARETAVAALFERFDQPGPTYAGVPKPTLDDLLDLQAEHLGRFLTGTAPDWRAVRA